MAGRCSDIVVFARTDESQLHHGVEDAMGNMLGSGQLEAPLLHTNLWFECGPQERASWVLNLTRHGGYDPVTRTMTPLHHLDQLDRAQFVLDSIAAAFEQDLFNARDFLAICFATRHDWREFLDELEKFDEYWVNERHFYAFHALLGDETACKSYPRIAKALARRCKSAASPLPE
jgi:hypothetical protein